MSNSFSISDEVLIAALEAKVDIIDTVVDTIRATDVPNIQTNIDANETKIDTIDGIVDAIKLKTDLLPQDVIDLSPMTPYFGAIIFSDTSYSTKVNVSGHGYFHQANIDAGPTEGYAYLKVIIDGTLVDYDNDGTPTGRTSQTIWNGSAVGGNLALGGLPHVQEPNPTAVNQGCSLIRFDTSLVIQVMNTSPAQTSTLYYFYSLT